MAKYPKTLGRIEAVWNKLGGEEGVDRFLANEIEIILKTIVSMFTCILPGAENLIIGSTTGERTIAKAKALFAGYIAPDFKNWKTDVSGEERGKTSVEVRELVKDATYAQMLGDIGRKIDDLVLTQDQIITFIETHRSWLPTGGYATFFPFKVNDEVFVAYVLVFDDGRLKVFASRLLDGHVWPSVYRFRVVVCNLNLKNLGLVP